MNIYNKKYLKRLIKAAAGLSDMTPIDYFSKYKQELADNKSLLSNNRSGRSDDSRNRDNFIRLTSGRQAVVMPRTAANNLGWTGREVRQGGSEPVSRYTGPINQYRNTDILPPGYAGHAQGKARWEDLPSTRMMLAASGRSGGGVPNLKNMDMAARLKWDMQAGQAYLGVRQRAQARQAQTATSAAYNEILKRLNSRQGADPKVNQERARRLAPLVAKNYRQNSDGTWSLANNANKSYLHSFAKKLGKTTATAAQMANAAPAQATAPAVAPAAKPAVPAVPAKTAAARADILRLFIKRAKNIK